MHVRTLTLQEAPKEPTSKWCEIALIRLGVGGAEGGGGGSPLLKVYWVSQKLKETYLPDLLD